MARAITVTVTATGSMQVTNGSDSYSMTELYIALHGSSSWGPNQLSSNLAAGAAITFTNIAPGSYDVRSVWSSGTTASTFSLTVSSGLTTYATMTPTTGNLRVTNGSGSYSMTELYISPSGSSSWGPNQLSSSLSAGSAITITQISPGSWDVKAVWSTGGVAYTYSLTVSGGLTTYVTMTPPAPTTGSMQVTNGSGSYSMTELYIIVSGSLVDPAIAGNWGPNQLSSSLSPGWYITFTSVPAGTYWVKSVWSNGSVTERFGFPVANGNTTYIAQALPPGTFNVHNGSASFTMTELYISRSSSPVWGPNWLGGSINPLPPSWFFFNNWVGPDTYDVRAVWSDGSSSSLSGTSVTAGNTTDVTMTRPGGGIHSFAEEPKAAFNIPGPSLMVGKAPASQPEDPLEDVGPESYMKVFIGGDDLGMPKEPFMPPPSPAIEGLRCIFLQGITGEPKVRGIILKATVGCENSLSSTKQ